MLSGNRPSFPILHLFLAMWFLSATQTLLAQENSNYTTKTFSFKIPEPWYYAIPEGGGKTVATCYLGSRLRLTAKGRFIVDTGKAAASVEKTAEMFATRMVPKDSKLKVEKTSVKLGNVDAVLLKSDAKDYTSRVPPSSVRMVASSIWRCYRSVVRKI